MRISDWSSDVCSSDLSRLPTAGDNRQTERAWDYGVRPIPMDPILRSQACRLQQGKDSEQRAFSMAFFDADFIKFRLSLLGNPIDASTSLGSFWKNSNR